MFNPKVEPLSSILIRGSGERQRADRGRIFAPTLVRLRVFALIPDRYFTTGAV